MTIGDRLKALRIERNKTLEEAGKVIGASKQTMYKYENGDVTNIPLRNIEKLAEYFNVNPGYLMGWNLIEEINYNTIHSSNFGELIKATAKQLDFIFTFDTTTNEITLSFGQESYVVSREQYQDFIKQIRKTIGSELDSFWNELVENSKMNFQTLAAHKIGDEDVTEDELKLINKLLQEYRGQKKK